MPEHSPYMQWSKQHAPARFDLSGSNLLPCTLDDLPGAHEVIALSGSNPDGYPPLLEAIAQRYGVTPDCVATAPGAGGANFLVLAALVRSGDEVLVERPVYDPLIGALRLLGAHITRFDRRCEEGWRLDPDRVAAAFTSRTRLIVLTNPHNPSGVMDPPSTFSRIAELARRTGSHVLVDEAYLDIALPFGAARPAAADAQEIVSTSSLTKSYGLNGLRAGWVVAAPALAERVRRVRDVMDGISPIVTDILAALAFAHLERLHERARTLVEHNRRLVEAFMARRTELEWVPPSATIAFPRIRGIADAGPFVERLRREHETQLVPGSFFDAPAHFRIAFAGDPVVLEAGLARVERALASR